MSAFVYDDTCIWLHSGELASLSWEAPFHITRSKILLLQCAYLHLRKLQQQLHEAGGPPVIGILLEAPPGVGLAGRGQQPQVCLV